MYNELHIETYTTPVAWWFGIVYERYDTLLARPVRHTSWNAARFVNRLHTVLWRGLNA